ncbi:MAG: sulfite exporter TauE/SafE family protein [Actinomycetota bacterium]
MSLPLLLSVVGVGVLVGVMSAMFGVGGGVIMVPYIVTFLDKSQHVAEGTSLAVIVPTAIAGVIAHRRSGYASVSSGFTLASLGVVGSVAGARLALSLDPEVLQGIFGVFTALVGVRLLYDGLRRGRGTVEAE